MADRQYTYQIVLLGKDLATKQIKDALTKIEGASVKSFNTVNTSSVKASTAINKFATNFSKLAVRVGLAIPVFYALRSVYQGIFNTLRDGMQYLVDFDSGITKALAVTSGVQNVQKFRGELENLTRALSTQTGATVKEITDSFYQFGTSGLDAATSLAGMETALKTSIALMGDSNETAKSLADIYKLLGNTITGATTPTEKFQVIGGTLVTLWKTNAFTLKEFTDGIQKFAGVAATFNLTFDETAAILASVNDAAQRGATGGTQLARSFSYLVKNIDDVNSLLRRNVKITKENIFVVFEEVLNKLNDMGPGAAQAQKAFEIFGEKATRAVTSLSVQFKKFQENLKILQEVGGADRFQTLIEEYNRQMETLQRQLLRTKAITNVAFESFVTAATDSNNLTDALTKLNNAFIGAIPSIIKFGAVIGIFVEAIQFGLQSITDLADVINVLNSLTLNEDSIKSYSDALKELTEQQKVALSAADPAERLDLLKAFGVSDKVTKTGGATFLTNVLELAKKLSSKDRISAEDLFDFEKIVKDISDKFNTSLDINQAGLLSNKINEDLTKALKDQEAPIEKSAEELANKFADSFQSSLKDALLGKGEGLFSSILNSFKDQLADSISKGLIEGFKKTDISRSIGTGFSGIQDFFSGIFTSGEPKVYKQLLTSPVSQDTISQFTKSSDLIFTAMDSGGKAAAKALQGGLKEGSTGLLGSLSSVFSGVAGKVGGGLSNVANFVTGKGTGGIGNFSGFAAGAGALGATLAVSRVIDQAASEGGSYWTKVARSFSLNFGDDGLLGLDAFNILGLRNYTKRSTKTTAENLDVASKIDITNKRLEMVNRDLSAIRNTIETYILPESAYLSESTVADNFAIDRKRLSR